MVICIKINGENPDILGHQNVPSVLQFLKVCMKKETMIKNMTACLTGMQVTVGQKVDFSQR